MKRVVVTGANRGIGLEFVRQLLEREFFVEAGARRPHESSALDMLAETTGERLRIHQLDVADEASVESFARRVGEAPLDLLINNAGVGGQRTPLGSLEPATLIETFRVNAVGPLLVTRALLPALRRGQGKTVVHLSSGMGSIGDNQSGGYYGYRMSKAALNMASRNLAIELRADGIVSVVMNPGWVKTDMGGPSAPLGVGDSVRLMLARIDELDLSQSGAFLNYRGGSYVW